MPELPPSYRAEPDPAFADRLEATLIERLVHGPVAVLTNDAPTSAPPTGTATSGDATDAHRASIDLDMAVPPRPERRRTVPVALSAAAAVVLVVALAAFFENQDGSAPAEVHLSTVDPAPATPASPFEGVWVATDTDGSSLTMEVVRSGDVHDVVVADDAATICSGAPSTMVGAGALDSDGNLVLPRPVLTCDDGTSPNLIEPPLEVQLANLTFVHDPDVETLVDGLGVVWWREGTEERTVAPFARTWWPQSNLEEVRSAQELADAGDARASWQVDPRLQELEQPGRSEILARFLRDALGWDEFRWADFEGFGIEAGTYDGLVFVRCLASGTNALYPDDSEGGNCAPTVDDHRYETVNVVLSQPERRGPTGIWVVTGWMMIEPVEQVPPPSEADAEAQLQTFLQARLDGEGAEGYLSVSEESPLPPLLYATTAGARYERFEFVAGEPQWPDGGRQVVVRLFADGGDTVVEQVFELAQVGGDLRLVYAPERQDAPTTTENGEPVEVPHTILDGELSLGADPPWRPRPAPEQSSPTLTTLGLHWSSQDGLSLGADLAPVGPDCRPGPAPLDAGELAQSLRSDPDLVVTERDPVRIAGIEALSMDVVAAPGVGICDGWETTLVLMNRPEDVEEPLEPDVLHGVPLAVGNRMRLHLLDVPVGPESTRVLAVAVFAPEERFERVLRMAAPILDSIVVPTR